MAITTAHDYSSVAPRSVKNIDAVATTQTPVASPYYVDQRDVVPTVYTFVDTTP
jgi:hypothetical protein